MGSDQNAYDKKTSLPFGPTWCGMCSRHSRHLLVQSLTCALLTLSHSIFSWWTPQFWFPVQSPFSVCWASLTFEEWSFTDEDAKMRVMWKILEPMKKSIFDESLRWQLKGQLEAWGLQDCLRSSDSTKVWPQGWGNLHCQGAAWPLGDLGLQDGAPVR